MQNDLSKPGWPGLDGVPPALGPAGGTVRESAIAPPLLATATQVAEMLCVSRRTLWRLVSGRKLPPPLRIGGAVRWRVGDIETWIAAGCPAPANP